MATSTLAVKRVSVLSRLGAAFLVIGALSVGTMPVGAQTAPEKSGTVKGPGVQAWNDRTAVEQIGVGSCLRQNRPAPILRMLAEARPDVFVFLGDNIYGDTEEAGVFAAKYRALLEMPGFRELRKRSVVLAIWDDHDYGKNDAGVEYGSKELAKRFFLDFWGIAKQATRAARPGNYDAVTLGPVGRRVQFILLDTRWFRSPLVELPERGEFGPYGRNTDPASTLLGAEQWAWLEEQLKQPAEVRVICSSVQVLADEHQWEKWGNFPHERQRLLELIDRTDGVVVAVSGDRHTGELSRVQLPSGRFVVDLTASALNQGDGLPKTEPNELRVGKAITEPHAGWISIDWAEQAVRLQLRRESGSVIQETRESFTRLLPRR